MPGFHLFGGSLGLAACLGRVFPIAGCMHHHSVGWLELNNCWSLGPQCCSAAGRGMATIAYTAPEAIDGPATPATDMWSFGIMLNQMVTGKVSV